MAFAVSWTSERDSRRDVGGNDERRVLGAALGLALLMDPEEAVRQRDLVHLAGDQVRTVRPGSRSRPRCRRPPPRSAPSSRTAVAVSTALGSSSAAIDLADAERRARTGRLDEDGIGELVRASIVSSAVDDPELRRGDPRARWRRCRPGTCPCTAPSSGCRSPRRGCRTAPAGPASRRPRRACRAGPGNTTSRRIVSYRPCSRTSSPWTLRSGDSTAGGSCRSPSPGPGRRRASRRRSS